MTESPNRHDSWPTVETIDGARAAGTPPPPPSAPAGRPTAGSALGMLLALGVIALVAAGVAIA